MQSLQHRLYPKEKESTLKEKTYSNKKNHKEDYTHTHIYIVIIYYTYINYMYTVIKFITMIYIM